MCACPLTLSPVRARRALRTAIGKARRGSFKNTTPDDLLKAVLEAATEGVDKSLLGEVTVGNVQLGGAYSGPARMAQLRAGFPETVPLHSLNRQCSSGLQAVASIASGISAGFFDAGVGAGVESMTHGGGVAAGTSASTSTFSSRWMTSAARLSAAAAHRLTLSS